MHYNVFPERRLCLRLANATYVACFGRLLSSLAVALRCILRPFPVERTFYFAQMRFLGACGKGGNVDMDNEQRIGVVAIVVSDKNAVPQVQNVLSVYGAIIVGRMGIPDHESGKNVIALIVKGKVEQVSALTGALGRIDGVSAKSLMTK